MIVIIFGTSLFFTVLFFTLALKAYRRGMHIWTPTYLGDCIRSGERKDPSETIHVMLCIVDHFEPGNGKVDLQRARARVSTWLQRYPALAEVHQDSDGRPPQHTWFFPPHYHQADHLERIVSLCTKGYGEIEMHLHHDHQYPFPETETSLAEKIERCLKEYAEYGIWGYLNGRRVYAFIHGNWALDNSAGGKYCGVNNELSILAATGCYADFTFPAPNQCQPKLINRIYYVKDDPNRAKSFSTGIPVRVGGKEWGDLMIIQGPIGLRWKSKPFMSRLCIETAEIDHTNLPIPSRIDYWVKSNIHVIGRPNWIFIKLHCHGAPEVNHESLLGEAADRMYSYFESKYDDGQKYTLHYVTAREMYNIIKAAEAGEVNSPNQYRDYLITKPTYAPKEGQRR